MAKKIITISLEEDLNARWDKVSKKHQLTKSGMVVEYIERILPILEEKSASKMMAEAMKQMANEINTTATLFDNMEYDKSIEDYKEMKRG